MSTTIASISGIIARRVLDVAMERMRDEPVIALQGPRAVGKSLRDRGSSAGAHA